MNGTPGCCDINMWLLGKRQLSVRMVLTCKYVGVNIRVKSIQIRVLWSTKTKALIACSQTCIEAVAAAP